jgi:hypothetical protein
MKKLTLDFPIIRFINSFGNDAHINIKEYLNHIAPDLNNPYRSILKPEFFSKVYIWNNKLVWDNALELTMCGGESKWMAAEFSEKELLEFVS